MKKVLILEDEKLVYDKIKGICDELWYTADILFTNLPPKDFSLSNYDYILIDRDNELAEDWSNNFHDFFESFWYKEGLLYKCIFISWSQLNNESLAYRLVNKEIESKAKEAKDIQEISQIYTKVLNDVKERICSKSHPNWLEKVKRLLVK